MSSARVKNKMKGTQGHRDVPVFVLVLVEDRVMRDRKSEVMEGRCMS
jgi:hypothetical protein